MLPGAWKMPTESSATGQSGPPHCLEAALSEELVAEGEDKDRQWGWEWVAAGRRRTRQLHNKGAAHA